MDKQQIILANLKALSDDDLVEVCNILESVWGEPSYRYWGLEQVEEHWSDAFVTLVENSLPLAKGEYYYIDEYNGTIRATDSRGSYRDDELNEIAYQLCEPSLIVRERLGSFCSEIYKGTEED